MVLCGDTLRDDVTVETRSHLWLFFGIDLI